MIPAPTIIASGSFIDTFQQQARRNDCISLTCSITRNHIFKYIYLFSSKLFTGICKYLKKKIDFRKSNDRQAVDDNEDDEDGASL